MPLGTIIGQSYNGTLLPLIVGIALLSGLCILAVGWAESN
jgi:DHA1 family bicyclomycin/chloramphenicol resistance-like MFS transporter